MRVPYIPQLEATECGAACLAMVLGAHGAHVPLAEVRAACSVSRDAATALDLIRAGRHFGLESTAFQAGIDGLSCLPAPAILHWELNHFVVLERCARGGVGIVDPASGRRFVRDEELPRLFTGVVLVFTPKPGFVRRRRRRRSLARHLALLRPLRPALLTLLLAGALLESLALVYPAATQFLLDYVIKPRQLTWLAAMLGVLLGAALLSALLTLARDRISSAIRARTDMEFLSRLVLHLMRLPSEFHQRRTPADLASRVQAAVKLGDAALHTAVAAFDLLLIALYVALALFYDPALGCVMLVTHGARALVTAGAYRAGRVATSAQLQRRSRLNGVLMGTLLQPEAMKAFGVEPLYDVRHAAANTRLLNTTHEGRMAAERPLHWIPMFDAAGFGLLLWAGWHGVASGRSTIGVFASFLAVDALVRRPTLSVLSALQHAALIEPTLDRIDDVLDTPIEADGSVTLEPLRGEIEFDDVCFRYSSTGKEIVEGLSFRIAPGERVALVGGSGAGKSTVLKLVLGLLAPSSGVIRIDGHDMRTLDRAAYRKQVGAVFADSHIFKASVHDNIALGLDAEAEPETVTEAARKACVDTVIERWPRRYDTPLDAQGAQLSGGQRQRLTLARALARQPRLLLLDEATSSLDEELDEQIYQRLSELGATTLSATHRLSAVRQAQRVFVMSRGKLVQTGTFEQLRCTSQLVAELFHTAPATDRWV